MLRRRLTGIDLSGSTVRVAQIEREKKKWKIVGCAAVPFPPETVRASFKANNIIDRDQFLDTVGSAVRHVGGRVNTVGLALPNEVINISIQKYADLPKSSVETEKMLAWRTEKSLHFSRETVKISYQPMGTNPSGEKSLLVSIGILEVLAEYEKLFKALKIGVKAMQPAGLNQFNFFSGFLPSTGIFAFVGLFEYYFNIFIYEDGQLISYQGVKKGFADLHFILDVDIALQHYRSLNPGKKISKMFVGSQVGFQHELDEVLSNLSDMEVQILDPIQIIEVDSDLLQAGIADELPHYISAVGAALSLTI